jgi:hypothetical protein
LLIYLNNETLETRVARSEPLTENVSHWIDGNRHDGYLGRTSPLRAAATGKDSVGPAFHPLLCPPFCPP